MSASFLPFEFQTVKLDCAEVRMLVFYVFLVCLSLSGLLSPMKRDLLLRLQSEIENVTDAWLSTALKSLLLIQSRSVIIFSFNDVCHAFTSVFVFFFQLKMAQYQCKDK